MTLSIVIPAYNEERRLPSTLDVILTWLDASSYRDAELLIVDDGSTDATAAIVEKSAASEPRLRLLRNPGNRGKGYAVRHGMLEAKGDWILSTDADLSTPIYELPKLLAAAERRERPSPSVPARWIARLSECTKASGAKCPASSSTA